MTEQKHHPLGFSRWERRYKCPWSMKAEEGKEDIPSDVAEQGTRIHKHLEDWTDSDDPEEQEVIEACRALAEEVGIEAMATNTEETLPLNTPNGTRICYGTLDARRIFGRRFVLVDYKTGFKLPAPEVTLKQLGGQAAALMQQYPILTGGICYAIFGRLGTVQKLPIERDDLDDVVEWAHSMKTACEAATEEDINPGAWCSYCRDRDTCSGTQKAAEALVKVENLDVVEPEQIVRLLDLAEIVKPKIDLIRKRARNLLREGAEFPASADGKRWQLKSKRGGRVVEDAAAAFKRLEATMRPEHFLLATKVQIGKLENLFADLFHQQTGRTKKEAKAEMEALLSGVMRRKSGSTELTKE